MTTQEIINNSTLTQNDIATFNSTYVFKNVSTYYARIGFLNIADFLQIDNGKNNYLFHAYNSTTINDSNYLGIRGWTSSNNWSTNPLFKFFQNGGFNITTNIASTSTTTGSLQVAGGAGIIGNIYCGANINCAGNIYLGDPTSNTDPMYITRSNVGSNITEIAVYIGDDGTNSISYPSGETNNVDYFTIKSTNAGLHHCFTSTGNYYASNNINGIFIPKNSGGSITGINGNYIILNSASNGGFQYNNNNTEMLRIYKSSGTNYIGNGSNNFLRDSYNQSQ